MNAPQAETWPRRAMADTDSLDLDALQKLADNATAGPWKLWGMTVLADPVGDSNLDDGLEIARTSDPHRGIRTFNGEFICAARDAVPALISYARSLESQLAESQQENERLRETQDRHKPWCDFWVTGNCVCDESD